MSASDLSPSDFQDIQASLPELYKLRDLASLPPVMLQTITRLIPNKFCTYNEMNLRSGQVVAVYHPESIREPMEAAMPMLTPYLSQHPIYRNVYATGDGRPQFIGDYLSTDEWNATDFGRCMSTLGVIESLIFCLQVSNDALIFIALSRPSRDFTERDRKVAELLRSHFSAAYENAIVFTDLQALTLLSSHALDQSRHGVALVDAHNQVIHINMVAQTFLQRYFPDDKTWKVTLPSEVLDWMNLKGPFLPNTPPSFEKPGRNARLLIRYAGIHDGRKILLFEEKEKPAGPERLSALGLSRREAEVLHWTSEGRSNADIGIILQISPRTVGKHLEAIYEKLGVSTRFEAAMMSRRLHSPEPQA